MKHGQAGKGIFWDIIEMLYEQGGYLSELDIESYAFALHTDCETLNDIIRNFGLFCVENEQISSNSVLRRIDAIKLRSDKAKDSANARWSKTYANAMPSHSEPNAIKENKSKEKEIKLIKLSKFAQFWDLYDKKADRAKCENKFIKLEISDIDLILLKVTSYVQNTPDVQFRKNPLTWLNGKCWLDDNKPTNGKYIMTDKDFY